MHYPIERKVLFTFCFAVSLILLLAWTILQNSPRAESISGITATMRKASERLQEARSALSHAELAAQAYRITGDNRLVRIEDQAISEVAAALQRHDAVAPRGKSTRAAPPRYDLRALDHDDISRLIGQREADDADFLRRNAEEWERKNLRFNATVLLAAAVSLIGLASALCLAVLREISARRERDTAAARGRERLAHLMETLPTAYLSVEENLRVNYANGEACRLLGWDRHAILGRPLGEALPPSLAEEIERRCATVAATGGTSGADLFAPESRTWMSVEVSPSPYGLSVHMRDITEAKRAQETQERLLALLEATPDVVGIQDESGSSYFNRAGREMFGLEHAPVKLLSSAAEAPERPATAVEPPPNVFPIGIERKVFTSERIVTALDGRRIPVSQIAIPHKDESGRVAYVSTILRDVSEARQVQTDLQEQIRLTESYSRKLEEANRRLEALATTDGLTELLNHRAFQERLATEFRRAERGGSALSIVMIDVDDFKRYNDAFGHPAGDQVLKTVAATLHAAARQTDIAARYGGEEFVMILPETAGEGAAEVAERIRRAIEEIPWPRRPVTVSVGAATSGRGADTPSTLVEAADRALYWSKSQGRNRVTHADELSGLFDPERAELLVEAR